MKIKTKYKQTKICELVEQTVGGTWGPESDETKGIPVLRSTNFTKDQKIVFENIAYRDITDAKLTNRILKNGDILIEISGGGPSQPVGRALEFINPDGKTYTYGNFVRRLKLNSDLLTQEYLSLALKALYIFGETEPIQTNTTNLRNLNFKDYINLEIPVPTIQEQKQIVSKIKECFTLLDKSEEKLKQAEVRLQKILDSEMKKLIEVNKEHSNWTANTVKELSNKIQYGFTAKASNKGNAKMLRITDIQKGNVDWNNVPLIQITPDELSKYKLEKGDILFARSGATAGKSYIYQSDNNEQDVFASYLIRVQTNPNQILAEYLYQYFQTRSYWDQIMDKVDGTAQPNVNGTKLGEIQIHYPKDLSEQSTIANKLKSLKTDLEKIHSDLVATRNRSETLRQSILKKAFEGKLI